MIIKNSRVHPQSIYLIQQKDLVYKIADIVIRYFMHLWNKCYFFIFTSNYYLYLYLLGPMNLKLSDALITLQNSKESQIPAFSAQLIEQCRGELKKLNEEIKILTAKSKESTQKTNEQQAFEKAKIALLFDQVYRIKRFLLLYYNFRCDRIEDQFWNYGGDLHHTEKHNLTEGEKVYFQNYKGLVTDYVQSIDVELTIDLQPPLQVEVQYRMLKDCGQILDQKNRVIRLQQNSSGYIKKKIIEPYVKQGYAIITQK